MGYCDKRNACSNSIKLAGFLQCLRKYKLMKKSFVPQHCFDKIVNECFFMLVVFRT
jgi:hypothetical protein